MEDKRGPPPNTGVINCGRKVLIEALFWADRRIVPQRVSGYKVWRESGAWERFQPISGYKNESVSAIEGCPISSTRLGCK